MTFKRFIIEGGAAIKHVTRINQLNSEATVTDVFKRLLPLLNIKELDVAVLGSASKKDPTKNGTDAGSSGDIDLAVSKGAFGTSDIKEIGTIVKAAAEKLGVEYRSMPGIDVISLGWPIVDIDGKQSGASVQLDIMPVENLEWAKWSYYSPSYNESAYKGLFRNEVLFYCFRNLDTNVTHEVNNEPATWARYFYDLNQGVLRGAQTRLGKDGEMVSGVKTLEKVLVTADPDKAAAMVFGEKFKAKDLLTWEQVLDAMHDKDFPLKDKLPLLYKNIADGIVKKKQPIPPELQVFL